MKLMARNFSPLMDQKGALLAQLAHPKGEREEG